MKIKSILSSHNSRRKVQEYLAATQAKNTQLAYRSDIAHFLKSGGRIPATPHCVASYLAVHASTLSLATLNRRVVAIGHAHKDKGLASPTRSALVTDTLRGIRRINGSRQRQVMPLLKADLVKITWKLTGLIGLRDKALLLTGFAGAFRRSELVALQVEDVRFVTEGALINVRRSKTDQNGVGRKVAIPYIKGLHCPVRALKTWLKKSGIKTGALFRRMNRFDQITDYGLCAASVALIIKQRVAEAGFNPKQYSGHSLRAGLVTSAAKAGVSSWKIRQQTAHKSDVVLQSYIRDGQLFHNNAVSRIW